MEKSGNDMLTLGQQAADSHSLIMEFHSNISEPLPFRHQLYELMASRKSIRCYKPDEIPRPLLKKILDAGMHAPSGKNSQNWRFFVVTGTKLQKYLKLSQKSWLMQKDSLEKKLKPSLYRFTERFFYTLGNAPAVVFCYAVHDPDVHYKSTLGAIYMAMQNIILASLAEGLGTCTMGAPLKISDEVDEFLDIKSSEESEQVKMELVCSLVIGWPDHDPPKAPRKTENRVRWFE